MLRRCCRGLRSLHEAGEHSHRVISRHGSRSPLFLLRATVSARAFRSTSSNREDDLTDWEPISSLAQIRATHDLTRTTKSRLEASDAELEKELFLYSLNKTPGADVSNILHELLVVRRTKPTPSYYTALILQNQSAERGSSENVRRLLQEMEEHLLPANRLTYVAALRVLVVHPDVTLLSEILQQLSLRWIDLSRLMAYYVSAIYFRAGQIEMGMEWFDRLEQRNVNESTSPDSPAPQTRLWLYVIALRALVKQGEWEMVNRLCYRLHDSPTIPARQIDIPHAFWHWMLAEAVKAGDIWVSAWVWTIWVLRKWVIPSPQLCADMACLAAENTRLRLADSCITVLASLLEDKPVPEGRRLLEDTVVRVEAAYAKAGELPLTTKERKMTAPFWWAFSPANGIKYTSRIDPWSALPQGNDGQAPWPRIIQDRKDASDNLKKQQAGNERDLRAKLDVAISAVVESPSQQVKFGLLTETPISAERSKAFEEEENIQDSTAFEMLQQEYELSMADNTNTVEPASCNRMAEQEPQSKRSSPTRRARRSPSTHRKKPADVDTVDAELLEQRLATTSNQSL